MHRYLRCIDTPFWILKGLWVLVGLKVQESHNYSHARGKDTQVWSTLQSLNEHQGDTAPLAAYRVRNLFAHMISAKENRASRLTRNKVYYISHIAMKVLPYGIVFLSD